jgi:hypothetical protein
LLLPIAIIARDNDRYELAERVVRRILKFMTFKDNRCFFISSRL